MKILMNITHEKKIIEIFFFKFHIIKYYLLVHVNMIYNDKFNSLINYQIIYHRRGIYITFISVRDI
jgi:hypothetical protein